MTFPTDDLVQKASTLTANWQQLIPQLWAAKVERNLRKESVFLQSVVNFDDLLVPGAGDKLYVPSIPDLGPLPALTEGTPMNLIAMNNSSSVTLQPSEYGTMVSVTRKLLDRIKYNGVAEILDRLAYSSAQTTESQFAALYNGSVPGTSNKLTGIYVNGKTTSNITAQDTFNDLLILTGIATLRTSNNFPFPDNYWRLYINPVQWQALYSDTNIRQDLRYADPETLLNGEVGRLHGCRIIVTNYINQTQEGASNGVTVNNALLVAPRWACIAWKRRPEAIVDPTLYDGGRERRFGMTADFDIELLHAERAVVLKSA